MVRSIGNTALSIFMWSQGTRFPFCPCTQTHFLGLELFLEGEVLLRLAQSGLPRVPSPHPCSDQGCLSGGLHTWGRRTVRVAQLLTFNISYFLSLLQQHLKRVSTITEVSTPSICGYPQIQRCPYSPPTLPKVLIMFPCT